MTTVIAWKYFCSWRRSWRLANEAWRRVMRVGWGDLTDKINYAMLDLAEVILFSIGFIRILIRFCALFPTPGFRFCFVPDFTQNKNRSFAWSVVYGKKFAGFKPRIRSERDWEKGQIFLILSLNLLLSWKGVQKPYLKGTELFNLISNLYHALFWSLYKF